MKLGLFTKVLCLILIWHSAHAEQQVSTSFGVPPASTPEYMKCQRRFEELGCTQFSKDPDVRDCRESTNMAIEALKGVGRCVGEIQNLGLQAMNGFGLSEIIKKSESFRNLKFERSRIEYLRKCQTDSLCLEGLYRSAWGENAPADKIDSLKTAWFYKIDFLWNKAATRKGMFSPTDDPWFKESLKTISQDAGWRAALPEKSDLMQTISKGYSRLWCLNTKAQADLTCAVGLTAAGGIGILARSARLRRLAEIAETPAETVVANSSAAATPIASRPASQYLAPVKKMSEPLKIPQSKLSPLTKYNDRKVNRALENLALQRDPLDNDLLVPTRPHSAMATTGDGELILGNAHLDVSDLVRDFADDLGIRTRLQGTQDIELGASIRAEGNKKVLVLGEGIFSDPVALRRQLVALYENEARARRAQRNSAIAVPGYFLTPESSSIPFHGLANGPSPTSKIVANMENKFGTHFKFRTMEAAGEASGNNISIQTRYAHNIDDARGILIHEITHVTTDRKAIAERQLRFTPQNPGNSPFRTHRLYNRGFRADEVEARIRELAESRRVQSQTPSTVADARIFISAQREVIEAALSNLRGIGIERNRWRTQVIREVVIRGERVRLEFPVQEGVPFSQARTDFLKTIEQRLKTLDKYERHLNRHYPLN